MLHALYLLLIAPLEFLMRLVLEWGYSLTHSWGVALVFLSLLVNTLVLPIYNRAEGWQEEERELKRRMARNEAMFRRRCKGWERFVMLSTLRRLHGYDWRITLRASVGLLLQIPFFFAAFHLLSHYTALNGQSLGPLSDLGKPDALLSLGGFSVNVLPIAMTAVNLFSAFFYTRSLTRRDKAQIYGMAAIFLVLLYNAASALTLYWTLNNVYSLGKNIVEKDWLKRPGWRTFWDRYRKALVQASAVKSGNTGGIRPLGRRFFRVAGYSFCIGCVFWLYVCTVAWSRSHNALGQTLRAAMWDFGGQCAWAALLVCFVLVAFPSLPRFALVVAISTLFLLHPEFYKWLFEVEQTRFLPFDFWGLSGCLVFVMWLCGIILIRGYWGTLAKSGKNLSAASYFWLERLARKSTAPKMEAPIVASTWGTVILACLTGAVCGLFLSYFMPFCTFFYNIKEFDFNSLILFRSMLPYFLLSTLAFSSLFYITTYFCPCECVKILWKEQYHIGAKVSIFHAITLIFLMLLWGEGTILSYRLPLLDGRQDRFSSTDRMILDSFVLLVCFAILLKAKQFIVKNILYVLMLIFFVSCLTLADSYLSGNNNIYPKYGKGAYGLRFVNRETLFSQFYFSNQRNIIVIIVDSLDSLSFEKTLDIYPELQQIFNGFIFFRENLGVGGARTDFAIPQILSGKVYDGDPKLFREFTQNTMLGKESMLADARREGFKVFVDADYWCVIGDEKFNQHLKISKETLLTKRNFLRLIFKFLPYVVKNQLQDIVTVNNFVKNTYKCDNEFCLQGDDVNKVKFNMMISSLNRLQDYPVFSFVHFMGVHIPFIKEDMIQTAREYIYDFDKFIKFLKNINVYDNTMFIVMADHGPGYGQDYRKFYPERKGTYSTVYFPLLLVKMPKSSGDMVTRNDLMSSAYVRALLNNFYSRETSNQEMEKFLKTLPKARKIYNGYMLYYPEIGTFEATGTFSTLKIGGR